MNTAVEIHHSPLRTCVLFLVSDILAILAAGVVCVLARYAAGGAFTLDLYFRLAPGLLFFVAAYWTLGLYPGVLLTPPEELKRLSWGTTLIFLCIGFATFFSREADRYSRLIFIGTWLLSVIAVPLARHLVRRRFADGRWWGYPALIFGAGESAEIVAANLRTRRRLGLEPVAFVRCGEEDGRGEKALPVYDSFEQAEHLACASPCPYAVVALEESTGPRQVALLERISRKFRHVLVVPKDFGLTSHWVSAVDIGGVLGLQTMQKLLDPKRQTVKRVLDLCLTLAGSLVILPVVGIVALLIKLEDRGPVFYSQKRVGFGGKTIRVWKFRSMVPDAEAVLERHLRENPALAAEWRINHKLKDDPRITRVGKYLRKWSLDELPQLWSVVRGDLSLVGPRPIVEAEIEKYGEAYDLYTRVLPGITGLWQVSGRSRLSYDKRINLDIYYIRNWSVWFDLYILSVTPRAVLSCDGAC